MPAGQLIPENFFERILPVFYQSAEKPDNWLYALDQIKTELQVGSVVVQKMKLCGNRLSPQWAVRDSVSTEQAESHDCLVNNDENPRLNLSNIKGPLKDTDVFRGDDYDPLKQPEFKAFEERLQMIGLGRPIILGVKYSEDSSLCMVLHRHSDDARAFDDAHAEFLFRLSPHLKQTVSLSEKIGQFQSQVDTLGHCVDQFNAGMLVLDSKGNLRWANQRAKQLLKSSKHLSITSDRLRCTSSEDQFRLQELLGSVLQCQQAGHRFVGAIGPSWDNPLQVLAVPVLAATEPYIALYLSEQNADAELSTSEVVQLFGLTPAEARLAIALYAGDTINEYAEKQGIASGTARIQLKSIFSKLGINRQPELVRLLGTSVLTNTRFL